MPANLDHFPHSPPRQHSVDAAPKSLSTLQKISLALKLRNIIQNKSMSSWKSKLAGILVIALPVLHSVLPDNLQWITGALTSLAGLFIAGGRDNKVTSEQAGAK